MLEDKMKFSSQRSRNLLPETCSTAIAILLIVTLFFSPGTSQLLAESLHKDVVGKSKSLNLSKVKSHRPLTVPPKSQPAALSHPRKKLNLRSLDLSKTPSEDDLRMAGQLGSPLSPSSPAEPSLITDSNARKKQEGDNLALGKAIQKWNEHKYPEAVALFRAHRREYPESPWAGEAELHLGCNAQFSGSWSEAQFSFDWILSHTPKGSDIYQKAKLRRSILHMTQGELDSAGTSFTEMLQTESDWERNTYGHYWIQQISLYKGKQVALRTCGRDSIAYVLESNGRRDKATLLRSAPAPTDKGYTLGELVEVASRAGLPAVAIRADSNDLTRLKPPFVAHYSDDHFVVVSGITSTGQVKLFDPRLQHECLLTREQFVRQWSGSAVLFDSPPVGIALASVSDLADVIGGCCGQPRYPGPLGQPPLPLPSPSPGTCARGLPQWQVNPVNMNLVVQDIPMWYDCPIGPAIEIKLTYNSQDALNQIRPFGNKWLFNYASYAMESPNGGLPAGSILVVMPDGRGDTYQPATGGAYTPPPGIFNTLTKLADYTYDLLLTDGTIYHYGIPTGMTGTSSLLLSIQDRNGNLVVVQHDTAGTITGVADPQGNVITLTYNAQGYIGQASDAFGRTATFSYDASGNLTGQTDMGGVAYSYTYDANVYLTSITKPTGTTLFYVEPADGTSNNSNPYPPSGGIMWENYRITVTDPIGYKEEYYYNGYSLYGWYRDRNQYLSPLSPLDASAPKTRYDYTLLGPSGSTEGVVSKITYADTKYVSFTYPLGSQPNLPTAITDENGYTTQFTYNSMGKVLTRTDPRNVTPANQYVTTYTYAPNNLDLTTITDFYHDTSHPALQIGYDTRRNVSSVADGLNRSTTIFYNSFGQPQTITDATGQVRTPNYNSLHQLTSVTQNGNTLFSIVPDAVGRPATVTNSDGYPLIYTYDNSNRLLRTTYPDSTYQENHWACCHLEGQRDRAGYLTQYVYDENNRLTAVLDASDRAIVYGHDPAGNLTQLFDGNENPTLWNYDNRNRVSKKIYADGSYYLYVYDGVGNLIYQTDAKQVQTTFTYDEVNNLTQISAPGLTTPIGFIYDSLNRRTQMTDGVGSTIFGYDLASQVTSIDGPSANDTIVLSYDLLGRYTGRTINNAGGATLVYDNYGRPQTASNVLGTFTFNYPTVISKLLSSVTATAGLNVYYSYLDIPHDQRLGEIWNKNRAGTQTLSKFDYIYNPLGQITTWTQQSGTSAAKAYTLSYDPVGELLSGTLKTVSTGAVLKSYNYTYDKGGNRTGEDIDNQVSADTPNNLNQLVTRQTGAGVLPIRGTTNEPAAVTVNGSLATTQSDNSFAGQANVTAGNNTVTVVATDGNGNAKTNSYNVVVTGSGTKSLSYDPNGNLLGDGTRTFEWDPLNRLTAVNIGTNRSEFTYNGLSQRVKIVENRTVLSLAQKAWSGLEKRSVKSGM